MRLSKELLNQICPSPWRVSAWFLKIALVQKSVYACVCVFVCLRVHPQKHKQPVHNLDLE